MHRASVVLALWAANLLVLLFITLTMRDANESTAPVLGVAAAIVLALAALARVRERRGDTSPESPAGRLWQAVALAGIALINLGFATRSDAWMSAAAALIVVVVMAAYAHERAGRRPHA